MGPLGNARRRMRACECARAPGGASAVASSQKKFISPVAIVAGAHFDVTSGMLGRTWRAARSSRQLDGYMHTYHVGVPGKELALDGDVEGPSQRFEKSLDLHQHPVAK